MAGRVRTLHLSGTYCLYLAVMLLVLPLQWLLAMVAAAAFHELCHWAAIRWMGFPAGSLRLGLRSANMALPEMSRGRELICALAGPAGSFVLVLLIRWIPRIAICAAVQFLYNLLPLYPMDGGRVLRSLLAMALPPPKAERIRIWIEGIFCAILLGLGLYTAFFLKLGLFPLLICIPMTAPVLSNMRQYGKSALPAAVGGSVTFD